MFKATELQVCVSRLMMPAVACPGSRLLIFLVQRALAYHSLLCCKSWILQLKARPFRHKLWAFQGIAGYLLCRQHGRKLDHIFTLCFAVTGALASAIPKQRYSRFARLLGCTTY